jgi:hypothetical protein
MIITFLRRVVLGLVLLGLATASAHALTLAGLQRLLKTSTVSDVPFHEVRESPWLLVPVESRGTMRSTPEGLEKRIESPRKETWRLLPDRMEWAGADGVGRKQILFAQVPAVATLANAIRRIVAGDLLVLQQDFRLSLSGDEQRWTVQLQPDDANTARYLDHLEMHGMGERLQTLIVVERQGERTTTRFRP